MWKIVQVFKNSGTNDFLPQLESNIKFIIEFEYFQLKVYSYSSSITRHISEIIMNISFDKCGFATGHFTNYDYFIQPRGVPENTKIYTLNINNTSNWKYILYHNKFKVIYQCQIWLLSVRSNLKILNLLTSRTFR